MQIKMLPRIAYRWMNNRILQMAPLPFISAPGEEGRLKDPCLTLSSRDLHSLIGTSLITSADKHFSRLVQSSYIRTMSLQIDGEEGSHRMKSEPDRHVGEINDYF